MRLDVLVQVAANLGRGGHRDIIGDEALRQRVEADVVRMVGGEGETEGMSGRSVGSPGNCRRERGGRGWSGAAGIADGVRRPERESATMATRLQLLGSIPLGRRIQAAVRSSWTSQLGEGRPETAD
jgi:hypothetical protein